MGFGGEIMANLKNAKKKVLVNAKKQERNNNYLASTKTAVKNTLRAIAKKDKKEAEELIEKTKKALEGEDLEEIKKAKDNLLTKANELATKVYEEAAKNNQTETNDETEEKENKKSNDDVVDAEFEEK